MAADKFRQRLDALFADIERLAVESSGDSTAARREIEALKTRLGELGTQFAQKEKRASSADSKEHSNAPILYEREQVGYAFSGNKMEETNAPITSGAKGDAVLAAPLVTSGMTIGEIQIESPSEHHWSQEEATLANSVARQVSLQIENLRLLAATERARAEAESASRRFTREGWESYLDAIERNERIGYSYDQSAVTQYDAELQTGAGFEESVKVLDEQIGTLYLRTDPNHPLTDDSKALVSAVANQIAQQVENIRLLSDASRARAEAEEATRRLARENWKTYLTHHNDETGFGFIYDSNQVMPLGETPLPQDVMLALPLKVRGETIGRLTVAGGKKISTPDAELATAIAAQTSIHLETLRLTEELQKRAAELQELDRLKSSFLANMSHELRTPLNSILGFSDVILEELDGPLTELMDNDLRLIRKNGQHLLHLINDVLDMAKIDAGRLNLYFEQFNVHELIEEVVSITSSLANEKSLTLIFEKDSDETVEIFADRMRIQQVLINLVNNAIKFTQEGTISIHVAQQDEKVHIHVSDTGIGIPFEHLETIFQEFAQVDTSTTRKTGGTGLGLPISRRLVGMHGGRLWAKSSGVAGEGSIFYIELPLKAEPEQEEKLEK